MLDVRPQEKEWLSWLGAGLWTALILLTIPLARMIADQVAENVGTQVFFWVTATAIATGIALGARALARRRLPPSAYLWLAVFGGSLLWMAWSLRGNPVEAFHLVQYGVLSLLVYRALLHRCRDNSIFVLSAVLTGIAGIFDEWIQWIIPDRYWGMRDVVINSTAAILTQGALATGLRPDIVRGWPEATSIRRLCNALAVFLAMLCISYANTPDRIAWYAERVPGAEFLLDSQSMMVEYGHRYEDPDIGVFRSRFDRDALRRLDEQRGTEVAAILDQFIGDGDWRRFRGTYTVPRDGYVHELGTHLFRRNRHLSLARDDTRPERKRRESYFIAQRENRILEAYFPTSIGASVHQWDARTRDEVDRGASAPYDYVSAVSRDLITGVGRDQVSAGFIAGIGVLVAFGMLSGRKVRKRREISEEGESA